MLCLDIYGNTVLLRQQKVAQIENPPRPAHVPRAGGAEREHKTAAAPPQKRKSPQKRTKDVGRTTYGAKCIARVERKISEPFFSSPRQKSRCTQRILFVGKCPLIIPTARRPRSLGLSSHSESRFRGAGSAVQPTRRRERMVL